MEYLWTIGRLNELNKDWAVDLRDINHFELDE